MEKGFAITHRTTYLSETRATWHTPCNRRAQIVRKDVQVGEISLTIPTLALEMETSGRYLVDQARCYPIVDLRSGLGGSVVTVHVINENGYEVAFYTDIPAPRE